MIQAVIHLIKLLYPFNWSKLSRQAEQMGPRKLKKYHDELVQESERREKLHERR